MSIQTRSAVGYSGGQVTWTGPDECAWTCGNAVVLHTLGSKAQRVLKGTGFGISCFAVNKRHGLLAIAEKGLKPMVTVYSTKTLQPLAKLLPGDVREEGAGGGADKPSGSGAISGKQQSSGPSVVLGVTCLAFSNDGERLAVCGDEPDCSVIVYGWRKAEVLGRCRMPAAASSASSTSPASSVSFHPLDASVLATSGPGGACAVWFLEPLWEKAVFRPLQLAAGALPAGAEVTCHAWGPGGLYVGTSTGGLVLVDTATMAPLQLHAAAGGAAGEVAGGASGGASSPTPGASSGGVAGGSVVAVVPDAVTSGAAVTALTLNRDLVAVAGADGSVRVFVSVPAAAAAITPEPLALSHEVWLGRAGPARGVAVASAECGGADHATLLLGCPDGTMYRAPLAPKQGGGPTHSALVVDCHVGRLAGVVPHPGGGAFLTTGSDGSVRVWSTTDGALLGRKQLSSAQTALAAAAPGASLAAVGSETGVVRVLVLPPASTAASAAASDAPLPALRVLFRQRLHSAPVDVLVFSPANDLLLSAGRDGIAWLCSVDARGGRVRPLGCLSLPPGERVLSATWPRSDGGSGAASGHAQAGPVSTTSAEGDEPSCLLSLAGGGLMCLTASAELHSGNWRNPYPDMVLVRPLGGAGGGGAGGGASRALGSDTGDGPGGPELVTIKLLRLEVAMLAVAAVPGDRYGDAYGLGADKQLHKLVLPAEAAAWAGLRARPLRSAQHVPAHARASGGVAVAPGGHLLASGAADGTVALRNMSLITLAAQQGGDGAGAGLHDITAGGVVTVSFDATGRYLASAGADGALFVYELVGNSVAGPQHLVTPPPPAAPPALPVGSAAASRAEGGDDFDDPAELTVVAAARREAALGGVEGAAGGESKRAAVANRLATLRSRIADLLAANEAAPELERLTRNDMIVDVGLVEELQRETENRVAAVQAAVKKEHLRTELLAERVRRMVWDSMAVKGAVISGLRAPVRVHNFPLTQPGQHERVLKQVTMLRRVELAEQAALGVIPYGLMFRGKGLEGLLGEDDLADGTHSTADIAAAVAAAAAATAAAAAASANAGGAAGAAAPGSAGTGAGAGAGAGGAAPASELDALLYSDFDVYCNTRKALQVQLLKQKMRDVQAGFNTDFNKVAAAKKADCDRIADLNARLDDTLKDLRKLGAGPPAGLLDERFSLSAQQDTRDNIATTVLTVREEEVGAERYVSPAERAKQEAARKADEDAAKRSAKDNAGERALRQMMGGTLAARGGGHDESNPFSLPKPAWLVALGVEPDAVNPKLITEEQNRELKEWQAKEKSLQEERAKRITVLEMELRTAKAAVEELVGRFDDSLAALAARRHRAAAEVCALESRIVMLAASVGRCAKTSEAVERGLLARLGAAKEAHGRAASELSERRAALAELESRQAQLGADERLMDRNFKKEFAEADIHLNRLLQLYRARKPEQLASMPGGGAIGAAGGHQSGVEASSGSFSRVPGGAPGLHRQASLAHSPSGAAAAGGEAAGAATAAGGAGSSGGAAPCGAAGNPPTGPPANITPTYTHALPLPHAAVAATTLNPFPDAPPGASGHDRPGSSALHPSHSHASVHGNHAHHHLSAAAAAAGHSDPLHNLSGLKPEGLDAALWDRFVAYRAERLAAEAGARAAAGDLVLARRDLPELESREAALGSEMEVLMGSITALRSERKVAAYDNEVQLRLLAGQVEAMPPRPASADMSDARLLGRGVVESLNSVVLGKGTKKVELLTAMKDFKRGIYAAQWEAQAADMRLDDLRAKIRDLQLLHVTRDMQTVLKDGEDRSSALEAANLEALMKQRERLHAKALEDKRRRLRKLAADVSSRSAQNQEVAVHLVTLGKVLEEQQRLQAGMQSANDQATRRMRSLVTHKKLKEIALAQQNELGELRQQLEKLRLRTYPTFIESGAVAGMPSPPRRLPPDIKLLAGSPSSSSVAGRT